MAVCPVCARTVVKPGGDTMSDTLFISSVPSDDELRFGVSYVGFSGKIFKNELYKATKVELNSCRHVYLWFHEKKATKKGADCFAVSIDAMQKELIYKTKVILVGADAVRHFTGLSVDDVNGLDVTEMVDDEDGRRYFALCSPANALSSVGELRFALNNLNTWLKE